MDAVSYVDTNITFIGEKFSFVQKGALEFTGYQSTVNVIFEYCVFLSSFGDIDSALVHFEGVTNLTMQHTSFKNRMIDEKFEKFDLIAYSLNNTLFDVKQDPTLLPRRVVF